MVSLKTVDLQYSATTDNVALSVSVLLPTNYTLIKKKRIGIKFQVSSI